MTPDALIRWYYESVEDCGAPGLDPVDSRGLVYAEDCGACGHRIRHETKGGYFVCGKCGTDWAVEERFILKGVVSRQSKVRGDRVSNVPSPSPGGSERRISRRVDVGVALRHFLSDPRWKIAARYYVANALGFTIRQLENEAAQAWGFPPLSKSEIGRQVNRARVEWATRLQEAGLLKFRRDPTE